MAKEAFIIYPDQLFEEITDKLIDKNIYLVEDARYFKDFKFHKKKLILHRASMKAFEEELNRKKLKVKYIDCKNSSDIIDILKKDGIDKLIYIDPVDFQLEENLLSQCNKEKIKTEKLDNPGFLSNPEWFREYFGESKKFSFTPFYIEQRKRLKILVTKQNKAVGGKWSFDPENRKKIPKGIKIPEIDFPEPDKYIREATEYVEKIFPDNPGIADNFLYPVTHAGVREFFRDFLEKRLALFGDYEDAIVENESYLFHSAISYALNTGLITPKEVINETLEFYSEHKDLIPLNSLEGFIRQVIGWREYIRAVYILKKTEETEKNFFGFTKTVPESFYTGTTGIEPIDIVIKRLNQTAYTHHIERLMVVGNFMLLCEFSPDEVYKWFMEMYIDAYDWVMVPNVYGMSQYADGGLIMTKPYISSSNYIRKMSDFEEGEWCKVWDALYWRFIDRQRDLFRKVPRSAFMVSTLDRKGKDKILEYHKIAENFMANL